MTIKLVEDFAVAQLRRDVRDSLQTVGEQVVVLAMRHPIIDEDAERCPECDDDVYNEAEGHCGICYGTRFAQPVKTAAKVWAMFSDQVVDETFTKQGVWQSDQREMQTEAFPQLMEHDFVLRVRRWTSDGRIAEIEGFYSIQKVTNNSVRTGNRFGQYTWDVIGQKAVITEVNDSVAITRYPVLGKSFAAGVVEPVGSLATPPPVAPDTKVVYVPVVTPAPEGAPLTPTTPGVMWRQVFFHRQNAPARTWTIRHPFGYNPSVTLFINDEEADTDVEFPDEHTAVLEFATPQTGVAQLI